LGEGELGPHLTQCGQGRGLPACQVSSWSIQPFGHNAPTSQTDRTGDTWQTGQTGQDNGPIALGEAFYKRSPKNDMSKLEVFCTCYLWPWFGPPLPTLQYVMYFRFCGRRHVLYNWAYFAFAVVGDEVCYPRLPCYVRWCTAECCTVLVFVQSTPNLYGRTKNANFFGLTTMRSLVNAAFLLDSLQC